MPQVTLTPAVIRHVFHSAELNVEVTRVVKTSFNPYEYFQIYYFGDHRKRFANVLEKNFPGSEIDQENKYGVIFCPKN